MKVSCIHFNTYSTNKKLEPDSCPLPPTPYFKGYLLQLVFWTETQDKEFSLTISRIQVPSTPPRRSPNSISFPKSGGICPCILIYRIRENHLICHPLKSIERLPLTSVYVGSDLKYYRKNAR